MNWIHFRQKLFLLLAALFVSALFVLILELSTRIFCSSNIPVPIELAKSASASFGIPSNRIIVNGKLLDGTRLTDVDKLNLTRRFSQMDLSDSFPSFVILGRILGSSNYADPDMQQCFAQRSQIADSWLERRLSLPGYRVQQSRLINCPLPNLSGNGQPITGPCFFSQSDKEELINAIWGDVVFSQAELSKYRDIRSRNAMVSIRGRVYNVGDYLTISVDPTSGRIIDSLAFMPEPLNSLLVQNLGQDMTSSFNSITSFNQDQIIKCMDKLFYAGVTESASLVLGCKLFNPVYYAVIGIFVVFVLIPKYLSQFSSLPTATKQEAKRSASDAYMLMMIHFSTEPETIVRQTIQAAALSNFRDSHKLLWIVCDGETLDPSLSPLEQWSPLDSVLNVLNSEVHLQEPAIIHSYISLDGSMNDLCLYSGTYVLQGRRIPYIVISKIGSELERTQTEKYTRPGCRGKFDSVSMALEFISNTVHSEYRQFTQLQYELYCRIKQLQIDPARFEYGLVLDGSTLIDANLPSNMVSHLEAHERVTLVSAYCQPNNNQLWNLYPQIVNHHIPSMASISFGSNMSWLWSECYLLRLKYSDGSLCASYPEIIANIRSRYSKTSIVSLEDSQLPLVFLETDNSVKLSYEPLAKCSFLKTENVLASFAGKRLEYVSNLILMASLSFNGQLQLFRYRIPSFLSLIIALLMPAFTIYCYLLIARTIIMPFIYSNLITVLPFILVHTVTIICQAVGRRSFKVFVSGVNYLVFGIPVECILVPLVSLFTILLPVANIDNHPSYKGCTQVQFAGNSKDNSSNPDSTMSQWKSQSIHEGDEDTASTIRLSDGSITNSVYSDADTIRVSATPATVRISTRPPPNGKITATKKVKQPRTLISPVAFADTFSSPNHKADGNDEECEYPTSEYEGESISRVTSIENSALDRNTLFSISDFRISSTDGFD